MFHSLIVGLIGPYLHSLEIAQLRKCSSSIESDLTTFGISCVKTLIQYQEIVIEHSTDIARLKKQARSLTSSANSDVLVVYNATIVTMETGNIDIDLLHEAVLVVRAGVVESVSSTHGFMVPDGATMINARGGEICCFLLSISVR